MGLSFSHGNYKSSYKGFNILREVFTWDMFGVDLNKLRGYDGDESWPPELQVSPAYVFLDHEDCDGDLKYKELVLLLPLLYEWQAILRRKDPQVIDRRKILRMQAADFTTAVELAIQNKTDLIFQ